MAMEKLRALVVEQEQKCEQLAQDLQTCTVEKWQLLRLLREKDEQLANAAAPASKAVDARAPRDHRAIVRSALCLARFWCLACTFRGWTSLVQKARSQRLIKRTKARVESAKLQHFGSVFSTVLRKLVGRQLGAGMRAFWLSSNSHLPDLSIGQSIDFLCDVVDDAKEGNKLDPELARSRESWCDVEEGHDEQHRCTSNFHSNSPRSDCRPMMHDDKFDNSPWRARKLRRGSCPTPLSEASTSAPPSVLASQGHMSTSISASTSASSSLMLPPLPSPMRRVAAEPTASLATFRLAHALKDAGFRRVRAAFRCLHDHAADEAADEAERARCRNDESRNAEAREALETELSKQLGREKAESEELKERFEESQRKHRVADLHAAACEQGELLASTRCEELEAQLVSKAQWREEAEQRIRRMVTCGEGLERERTRLRGELSEAKLLHKSRSDQLESLRNSLHQEEQLSEILKARVWALEDDRKEQSAHIDQERNGLRELVEQRSEQVSAMEKEVARSQEALKTAARVRGRAEKRAAEQIRSQFTAELDAEREQWQSLQAALHSRIAVTQEEVATERQKVCVAQASAASAEEAQVALQARLATTIEELAAAELRRSRENTERDTQEAMESTKVATAQLRAEFEDELARSKLRERNLELRLMQAEESGIAARSRALGQGLYAEESCPSTPRPMTPQLRELDAYAELVEQLRAEVSREKAAKEASAHSLAALRSSYRLLLQRSSGCNAGGIKFGAKLVA